MDSSHNFQRGDLLKVLRKKIYYHWAIYFGIDTDGKEYVVNLTRAGNEGEEAAIADDDGIVAYADEKQYKTALDKDLDQSEEEDESSPAIRCQIKKELFTYNSGENDKWLKDNSLDDKPHVITRTPDDTINVAMSWIPLKAWNYSLLYFNCEHFAHLCRNGQLISCQVNGRTFEYKGHKAIEKLKKRVPPEVFNKINADSIPPIAQGALE